MERILPSLTKRPSLVTGTHCLAVSSLGRWPRRPRPRPRPPEKHRWTFFYRNRIPRSCTNLRRDHGHGLRHLRHEHLHGLERHSNDVWSSEVFPVLTSFATETSSATFTTTTYNDQDLDPKRSALPLTATCTEATSSSTTFCHVWCFTRYLSESKDSLITHRSERLSSWGKTTVSYSNRSFHINHPRILVGHESNAELHRFA